MASLSIHSKLPNVGTTIFTVINALATMHKAINLGQGFPDFMMDPQLIALVNEAMQKGNNQYTHMNGLPALREGLAEKMESLYGAVVNADTEITITPGGTYAIYTALTTLLHPSDEVIVFEPAYDSYIPNIIINGAVPILIPLQFPSYTIDWDVVKAAITPKTKIIVLNNPHNPTGSILSAYDIEQLQSIVKNTSIFILSDEVYEHLIFDDKKHESILRYPDLMERSFVCFSFGKTYHCTGWKLGYCVAPAHLMKEFRKVHQFNCFSCNTPVQYALATFLQQKDKYLQLGKQIQKKRDHFQDLMQKTRFKALPTYGSYFQLYSYEGISEENEHEVAIRLIKKYGVAAIPVAAFYNTQKNNKVMRFCFVKKESTLEAAVDRLIKF
ncbi:MAG: aminotransferase class I/II-fold pyridoxal phosphate-dependent enzyme [Ferruginibacter sp.]|nr:aminotransferase class I/II-fold pyridoxal phosphate-dependent enzyme [Ferruginibacter sp.]